ncbi:MAG: hypothetical protein J6N15_09365 [Ruminiclostridium sp.]|nr:hypothetical protein [Ruminiclostridium sp.]
MYTSIDKISDRFGFSTAGTFRCAYRNTRTWVTAGIVTILVLVALLLISLVFVLIQAQGLPGAASAQLETLITGVITGGGLNGDSSSGHQLANFGFGLVGLAFGIILLLIAIITFLIILAAMRMGQTYKFKADEQHFTVIYPKRMNRTVTIEYDYITGLKYEEWAFLLAPKCLDVTIHTKQGDFDFRCIHTPMSKANGITETPFNIIRERIGIAGRDENVLINRDAAKEQKPGFFK